MIWGGPVGHRRSHRGDRVDTLIVGAGSAGSVLAERLSADPGREVVVLEAGHANWRTDVFVRMPNAPLPIKSRFYTWHYLSEPEPGLGGRRLDHFRGRMVGGCSSVNAMIYLRGNQGDYDGWAQAPGMQEWSWAHCLPYFIRMENSVASDPDDPVRGHGGPLLMERGDPSTDLHRSFLAATQQVGYPRLEDVNGISQEGFGPIDRNTSHGMRWSAADAYLRPTSGRKNLTVRTGAQVTRVLMDGTRAVGIEYRARYGRLRVVYADEVVLSGGVFNTPHLLQLSGIGAAQELRDLGIPVVHDLPGVGVGLQDHLEVYVQYGVDAAVSSQPQHQHKLRHAPPTVARWLWNRTGEGATNNHEVGGFVRSSPAVPYPDVMCHLVPIVSEWTDGQDPPHGFELHVGPNLSAARGRVRAISADPFAPPSVLFNYLRGEGDEQQWLAAMRIAREIGAAPALAALGARELSPGPATRTDEDALAWVRTHVQSALHPSCSARMGIDEMSVVDPATMRVHGIDGLRVVDASVLPSIPNSNIYGPVMMVAERAADIITGAPTLAPMRRADAPEPGPAASRAEDAAAS